MPSARTNAVMLSCTLITGEPVRRASPLRCSMTSRGFSPWGKGSSTHLPVSGCRAARLEQEGNVALVAYPDAFVTRLVEHAGLTQHPMRERDVTARGIESGAVRI